MSDRFIIYFMDGPHESVRCDEIVVREQVVEAVNKGGIRGGSSVPNEVVKTFVLANVKSWRKDRP